MLYRGSARAAMTESVEPVNDLLDTYDHPHDTPSNLLWRLLHQHHAQLSETPAWAHVQDSADQQPLGGHALPVGSHSSLLVCYCSAAASVSSFQPSALACALPHPAARLLVWAPELLLNQADWTASAHKAFPSTMASARDFLQHASAEILCLTWLQQAWVKCPMKRDHGMEHDHVCTGFQGTL